MSSLDFPLAKLKHVSWKEKLKSFLEGKAGLTEQEVVSHVDCQLGKWLYDEGLEKYKGVPEMQMLEGVHIRLHAAAKQLIDLKAAGQFKLAEKEFGRIRMLSEQLLSLLEMVEKKVKKK